MGWHLAESMSTMAIPGMRVHRVDHTTYDAAFTRPPRSFPAPRWYHTLLCPVSTSTFRARTHEPPHASPRQRFPDDRRDPPPPWIHPQTTQTPRATPYPQHGAVVGRRGTECWSPGRADLVVNSGFPRVRVRRLENLKMPVWRENAPTLNAHTFPSGFRDYTKCPYVSFRQANTGP